MYESNAAKDLNSTAKDLKHQAKKTVDQFGDQGENVQNNLVDASQRAIKVAGEYYDEAKSALSEFVDTSMSYAKRNPGRTILGAAAIGFLIGKVSRRRS